MSKQLWELSMPVDDKVEQRVTIMHRKWEFPVAIKVRAAARCELLVNIYARARVYVSNAQHFKSYSCKKEY